MPCLKVITNLPKHRIPSDFADRIIPVLSKCVKKEPEKFICVVQSDCQLTMFGDSQTPGAVATLESIGNLGPAENVVISNYISEFVQNELGVSPKRFFLSFYNMENYNIGIAGSTVQSLGSRLK